MGKYLDSNGITSLTQNYDGRYLNFVYDSSVYSGVKAASTSEEGGSFYFGMIRPNTSFGQNWYVRYRATVVGESGSDYANYRGQFIGELSGTNTTITYSYLNDIYSTSYYPYYYAIHRNLVSAGYDATNSSGQSTAGHLFGISFLYATANTTIPRTVTIEILEMRDCVVTLLESPARWSNIQTATGYAQSCWNSAQSNVGMTSSGLRHAADDNTITQLYMSRERVIAKTMNLCDATLYGYNKDGNPMSFSLRTAGATDAVTNLSTTRVYNTEGFDYTRMIRYTGNAAAVDTQSSIGSYIAIAGVDMRYTDNCVASSTANELGIVGGKPVYFRGIIKEDGLFYLQPFTVTYSGTSYQRAWCQEVDATNNTVTIEGVVYDYVYWLIGYPYYNSTYAASLYCCNLHENNKLYWFNGTRVAEYGANGGSDLEAGTNIEIEDSQVSALGYYYDASANSIVIGDLENNTATGEYSHAEGAKTTASGDNSHSEGTGVDDEGDCSVEDVTFTCRLLTSDENNAIYNEYGLEFTYLDTNGMIHNYPYYYIVNANSSKPVGIKTYMDVSINGVNGVAFNICQFEYTDIDDSSVLSENTTYTLIKEHAAFGLASHNEGMMTTAGTNSCHAEGYGTIASNWYSHSEGWKTIASGDDSHAEGSWSVASGTDSHAEGDNTFARGDYSHSEGSYTSAIGEGSHTEGGATKANGEYSHSEGQKTYAKGDFSHSEGDAEDYNGDLSYDVTFTCRLLTSDENNAIYNEYGNSNTFTYIETGDNNSISSYSEYYVKTEYGYVGIGQCMDVSISGLHGTVFNVVPATASSNYDFPEEASIFSAGVTYKLNKSHIAFGLSSHNEGNLTSALGKFSHAEGIWNISSGVGSHVEGCGNISSGEYSHAEGGVTKATGYESHAEGRETSANGNQSHSEGRETSANGYISHSEGRETSANGDISHSEGTYTYTQGQSSHAEGRYSKAIGDNSHAEGQAENHTSYIEIQIYEAEYSISQYTSENYGIWIDYYTDSMSSLEYYNLGYIVIDGQDVYLKDAVEFSYDNGISTVQGVGFNITYDSSIPDGTYVMKLAHVSCGTASHVEGTDNMAIGYSAHAEGRNTTAMGENSHTEGGNTYASGADSHAEGCRTIANGDYSHAEGHYTRANSSSAHSEGYGTKAIGEYTHAEGYETIARYAGAHAEGSETNANESSSHAEGAKTIADGVCSHAEGVYTTARGSYSHAEGNNTKASGQSSHAEGEDAYANGQSSHAEGKNTIANGNYSHAEGYGGSSVNEYTFVALTSAEQSACEASCGFKPQLYCTRTATDVMRGTPLFRDAELTSLYNHVIYAYSGTASKGTGLYITTSYWIAQAGTYYITSKNVANYNSHVEGAGTYAIGSSHAEGSKTNANGQYSHAEGLYTSACEAAAHAEGYMSHVYGQYSHVEGDGTTVEDYSYAAHAEGYYTRIGKSSSNSHAEGVGTPITSSSNLSKVTFTSLSATNQEKCEASLGFKPTCYTDSSLIDIKPGMMLFSDLNLDFGSNLHKVIYKVKYASAPSGTHVYIQGSAAFSGTFYITPMSFISSTGSHIEGKNTVAFANNSHAEGVQTITGGVSAHSEGKYTAAISEAAHSEGYDTIAYGTYSHAEGNNTTASEVSSHAEGERTHAAGDSAHSEGIGTVASGQGSHAEGFSTKSYGFYSHSAGKSTVALGEYSNAEGGCDYGITDASMTELDSSLDVFINNWRTDASNGTHVPLVAIGDYSHAEGKQTLASGAQSHSEGIYTVASGNAAHAEGKLTMAYGEFAHAEGFSAISKNGSHAEGAKTIADGAFCHSEGFALEEVPDTEFNVYPVTSDIRAYIQGTYNMLVDYYTDIDDATFVFGLHYGYFESNNVRLTIKDYVQFSYYDGSSTVSGWGFVLSRDTEDSGSVNLPAGTYTMKFGSVAYGIGTHSEGCICNAHNLYSHAEGYATIAGGKYSHAEGYANVVYGESSHCEGILGQAAGNYSHTEGSGCFTQGLNSHAEGEETKAIGQSSHAEGYATIASGIVSHAEGTTTTSSGEYSHSEGDFTNATGKGSHAEGYRTTASGRYSHAEGYWNTAAGDYQHVIGKYNTTDSTAAFIIGGGTHNYARNNIHVVDFQGNAYYAGQVESVDGFFETSDIRKKNVHGELDLNKCYDLIDKCSTILYTLKDDESNREQIGLIAQEVREFFPEIVSEKADGSLTLEYSRLTVVILRVLKDLIERVSKLEK